VESLPGLEPYDRLIARAPASFRGAAAASMLSTFALGSARARREAHFAWTTHAESVGFPAAGPEMWLGLTESRLIVWNTTFLLSRPGAVKGALPLTDVAEVAVTRYGVVTGLAVAFTTGQFIEVEAMRGRRLRRFAAALRETLDAARR
jgi:hypothetical protein